MYEFINKILNRVYKPLNIVKISAKNVISNYENIAKRTNLEIAPVLKSNAYGHDLKKIASLLEPLNPPFFCVDSLYEAYILFKEKIKTPILIMGYINPQNLSFKKLPFSYAVFDLETIWKIFKFQPHAGFHLFLDTGMNREGIKFDYLKHFLSKIPPGIKIEGIMSHLACGGDLKNPLTKKQIELFRKSIFILEKNGIYPKWKHLFASSSLPAFFSGKNEKKFNFTNLARVGLALYGLSDLALAKDSLIRPALSFITTLISIKNIKKGEYVGYNFTYRSKKDMKLGILPVGYNDGVDLRLSSKGFVGLRGKFCKIVGRVNMNITVVDITDVKDAQIGDEVFVYSSNINHPNSIYNAAKICKTIPYEILVHIHDSSKRVIEY